MPVRRDVAGERRRSLGRRYFVDSHHGRRLGGNRGWEESLLGSAGLGTRYCRGLDSGGTLNQSFGWAYACRWNGSNNGGRCSQSQALEGIDWAVREVGEPAAMRVWGDLGAVGGRAIRLFFA